VLSRFKQFRLLILGVVVASLAFASVGATAFATSSSPTASAAGSNPTANAARNFRGPRGFRGFRGSNGSNGANGATGGIGPMGLQGPAGSGAGAGGTAAFTFAAGTPSGINPPAPAGTTLYSAHGLNVQAACNGTGGVGPGVQFSVTAAGNSEISLTGGALTYVAPGTATAPLPPGNVTAAFPQTGNNNEVTFLGPDGAVVKFEYSVAGTRPPGVACLLVGVRLLG